MSSDITDRRSLVQAFERKVRRATWALVFEQLWLRFWIVLAFAGVFFLLSLLGVWQTLTSTAHVALVALLGAGLVGALVYAGRIRVPSREDAIRRIETVSGVPHRPATSYEDTLTAHTQDPSTLALWKAHRNRMAALLARLKPGKPRPRTDRFDRYALRALLLLTVAVTAGLWGDGALERLGAAFRFGTQSALANIRLDAWIAPPAYTGRPPVMLADGAGADGTAAAEPARPEVPSASIVIVRASGSGLDRLGLEVIAEGQEAKRQQAGPRKSTSDVSELREELKQTSTLRIMNGTRELARFPVDVIADSPPKIFLNRRPELTPRGSLKLSYSAEDDYGVASAVARVDRARKKATDPGKAWAQTEPLKGPRWPRTRPPAISLRLPHGNAKEVNQHTYVEMASHPLAGTKIVMMLEAKDVAGQIGRTEPFEMILPERKFTKPLARALVEQRKKLLEDHRYRGQVRTALAAVTHEPDGFMDARTYLGLRTAYYRLASDRSRAGMRSVISQLWQIALRIEDGDKSDAERRLRDAQERLAKALENGASDEEIQKLMQELRQALGDYMQQIAKEQEGQPEQELEGRDPNSQSMTQQDIEDMMRQLEESAKNGSREQAQQLLSEMQDLMERMQSGRMTEEQAKQNKEFMQMMEDLGEMGGDQQQLMDETFEEMRQQEAREGKDGSQGKPNMRGTPGGEDGKRTNQGGPPGKKQGKAQAGRGQPGSQQGQSDPGGAGENGGQAPLASEMQLTERQRAIKERLSRLQRDLRTKGGSPEQLDAARRAMELAEQALSESDLEGATEQQGEALQKLRETAQQMSQDMAAKMPQRYGRNAETQRDPLGRPQRSQGPDLGTSVKVPDKIDQQRAREILEELRRRSGEATRPPVELDYLERLLKRF